MEDSQFPDIIVSKEKFDRWCRDIDNSKGGYSYIWFEGVQKRRIYKADCWREGTRAWRLVCNSCCGKGWCMVIYEEN